MFLKKLTIENKSGIIRTISFRKGVNLIIDETTENQKLQDTGNSIGKTTVLRLIDYCLGSDGKSIYKDTEFSGQPNTAVQDFLINTEVYITAEFSKDLDSDTSEIFIERNFLKRQKKIQKINGYNFSDDKKFDLELKNIFFKTKFDKPTFRQIISKNIRVDKNRMDNIVRTLGSFGKSEEYEALFLFWLGIDTKSSAEKSKLMSEKKQEESHRGILKKKGELSLIEQKLAFHNNRIQELEMLRNNFNLNDNYNEDIENLNIIKQKLNHVSSDIIQLEARKDLIIESELELKREYADIDTNQIKNLYSKAKSLIPDIQTTFEQTVRFHKDLISHKISYITKELPNLNIRINSLKADINKLLDEERILTSKIKKSGVTEDLENIIEELNIEFEKKGNLEEQKSFWEISNENLNRIKKELSIIDKSIFSKDDLIKNRVTHFNSYFTKMSKKLYDENYILTPSRKKNGYDLLVTNVEGNPSMGKKKGQIAAFDFAYIQFADSLDIPCMNCILHDQLENVHDNQLNILIEEAQNINGQYIVPILRDKIPDTIDVSQYEILSLSQQDKLFRL